MGCVRRAGFSAPVWLAVAVLAMVALVGGSLPSAAEPAPVGAVSEPAGAAEVFVAPAELEGPAGEAPPDSAPVPDRDETGGVEDTSRRSSHGRTFVTPEGSYRTEVSAAPVNFRDARGGWSPIDTTLVESGVWGEAFTNAAGAVRVSLPDDLATGAVSATSADATIGYRLLGAKGAPSAAGSAATYVDAFEGGVDVRYRATSDGVKEEIILPSAGAVSSFRAEFFVDEGVRAVPNDRRGIDFVSAEGVVVGALAPPVMWDASYERGNGDGFSEAVMLRVVDDAPLVVETVADAEWLADPARVYPVVVDPWVTMQPTDRDTFIRSGTDAASINNTHHSVRVGYEGANLTRGLVKFDVDQAIGEPARVREALMKMKSHTQTVGSSVMGMSVHELTQSFVDAQTNWNNRATSTAWTDAGGTHVSAATSTNTAIGGGSFGWEEWYVQSLVQKWLNDPTTNNGVLVKSTNEASANAVSFHSWNYADAMGQGVAPHVVIFWSPITGVDDHYTYESRQLAARRTAKVNVASGNLVVEETDLGIKGTGMDLSLQRQYNSRRAEESGDLDLGHKWTMTHGTDFHGSVQRNGDWVLLGGREQFARFEKKPDGTFIDAPGLDATVTYQASPPRYKLTMHGSGVVYSFLDWGPVAEIRDRNQNDIDHNYSQFSSLWWQWLVTSVEDTQGRTTSFTRSNSTGLINTITDPASRTVTFSQSGGDLNSFTDARNKTTNYTYDANEYLTKITDPVGNKTKFVYDTAGRVTSMIQVTDNVNETGPTTTFSYNYTTRRTTVTDPRGNATLYDFDHQGRVTKVTDALNHTRDRSYTTNSNVDSYNGSSVSAIFQLTRDTNNNVTKMQSPASGSGQSGTASHATYPSSGLVYQPTSSTDPQQNCQSFRYDGVGNLTEVHAGLAPTANDCSGQNSNVKSVSDYNTNGTLEWQQAPGGNCTATPKVRCTTYAYTYAAGTAPTPLDQIVVTNPSPLGAETTNFDTLGRVEDVTDGRGIVTRYSYDALDRITQILFNGGTTCSSTSTCTTYVYDDNGNLTARTDNTGTTNFVYDTLNRLTKKDLPAGDADCSGQGGMTFTYDATGNVKTVCDAGGTVTYQYDPVNNTCWQLLGTSNNTCSVIPTGGIKYTYDDDDRRTSTVYPTTPVVTMSAEYFPDGNLKKIEANKATLPTATLINRRAYTYAVGTSDTALRRTVTDENGTITSYGYDIHNRLCWAKTGTASGDCYIAPPTGADRWLYEGVNGQNGNRTSQIVGGVTRTYQYNESDQLCWVYTGVSGNSCGTVPAGASVPVYDGAGNETTRHNSQTAVYNDKNQTGSFTVSGTTTTATYADADSTERTAFGATNFFNSPQGIVMTRTSSTNTHYLRDDQGTLVSQRVGISGSQRYYLYDGLGSVIGMINATAGLDQSYTYDTWGNITTSSGSVANPFRYVGGHHDTQTGLTKFGARYYDPTAGRWTQPDPSGLDPHYTYAANSPTNFTDPTGLYHEGDPYTAFCTGWVKRGYSFFSAGGWARAAWHLHRGDSARAAKEARDSGLSANVTGFARAATRFGAKFVPIANGVGNGWDATCSAELMVRNRR